MFSCSSCRIKSFRVYVYKIASWAFTTRRTWTGSSTTSTGWWRTSGPGRTSPTLRWSTTWAESSTPGRTWSAGKPNLPVPGLPGSRPADPGWPPRPRCPGFDFTTIRPWNDFDPGRLDRKSFLSVFSTPYDRSNRVPEEKSWRVWLFSSVFFFKVINDMKKTYYIKIFIIIVTDSVKTFFARKNGAI